MTQSPEEQKQPASGEEIPAYRFTEKRVDDSWKEEIRREREKLAQEAPKSAPTAARGEGAGARPQEAAARPGPKAGGAEEAYSKIFMTFLAGLAQQTLMQLGELENAFSGQREVDLHGARYTIDLLSTIQVKTKGNLTPDEAGALEEAIHDLRSRYVEIAKEVERQVAAKAQGVPSAKRPGPGGTIPGPGFGRKR